MEDEDQLELPLNTEVAWDDEWTIGAVCRIDDEDCEACQ